MKYVFSTYLLIICVLSVNISCQTVPDPFKEIVIKPKHKGKLKLLLLAGQYNMLGKGDLIDYVSPAMSFAKTLREFDSTAIIGLIPCEKVSSSIVAWQKSSLENSLYNRLIERASIASQYGKISGILFYQGERDAN